MRLVKYMRNKKGVLYGTIVAISAPTGPISIGLSLCNKKDKFDKSLGVEIATGRALKAKAPPFFITPEIEAEVTYMKDRARRYFKGACNENE